MPRFLIIAGILLAAALIFDPSANVEVVEFETAPATSKEEQPVAVPKVVAPQKSPSEIKPAAPAAEASPAAPAAVKVAPTVVAKADIQAEEAIIAPPPPLASAPKDVKDEPDISALVLLSPYEMKTVAQVELKRLSCYAGKIDGVWGSKSRAAISMFNERSDSSFHLNESVELLTALKKAPDGLCDRNCSDGSCEIIASTEEAESPVQQETKTAQEDAPSYLPPWMRGEQVAEASKEESEVSESYSATHTSVSQRVYERPRPARRPIYRAARKKRNWLPEGWPGAR
jgi:hypothetical protein